jgi:DNA mismatch endonuclease, patch repair protein
MTDFLSKETRSRVMARIRSKDTKPEVALRQALWSVGLRGWRCHPRSVPGKPDVAFTRARVAVFVDGRFWHGHPDYFTFGKSGDYWDAKIARTQERDRLANEALRKTGWCVLRFWDFEVEADLDRCVARVRSAVAAGRGGQRARSKLTRHHIRRDGSTVNRQGGIHTTSRK